MSGCFGSRWRPRASSSAVDWSASDVRLAAQAIDLEAERLSRLVRNLLDLSRIEAGVLRPDLGLFEVRELVEPVVDRLASAFDGRIVEIDMPPELPPVRVDDVFFDAALTNLLENAARYAVGAHVRVQARLRGQDWVELAVEDGGPGVPVEMLDRLFDKFLRVERRGDGARRGLGIGLSVVRGLVEAMGGDVTATGSALGGLAVRLTLPAGLPPDGIDG